MRSLLKAFAFALIVSSGLVVRALGAEEGHGGGNPVNVDVWQALFTIVVFVVLLIILSRAAFKPILAGLQKREKFIQDSIDDARRDREEAMTRLKELEQRMAKASEEASAIVEGGRRGAEAVKRRIEEDARKSSDALLERAKREIGLARDTALKDLYQQAADLAMNMAGTVLKRQLTPEDHQRLVQDALSEVGKQHGSKN